MKRVNSWAIGAALLAAALLAAPAGVATAGSGGSDYVFVVDCTGTMRYQGRGEATMNALTAFVDGMRMGDRIAVYGYGEMPFAGLSGQPILVDGAAAKERIKSSLSLPFTADRTDMTRGMEMAWEEWSDVLAAGAGGRNQRDAYVVLLTDGKLIPVYQDYSMYDEIYTASRSRLMELSRLFGDKGVPVYTVGLGRTDKIDGDLMTRIAEKTGGRYYASTTSDRLAGVFEELALEVRPQDVAQAPAAEPMSQGGVVETAPMTAETPTPAMQERAMAATEPSTMEGDETPQVSHGRRSGVLAALASSIPQTTVGALGILIGFVAIGIHRRQSWANAFTKPLLGRDIRVRGYLKPWHPKGSTSARACIPIENPGLPLVEIGPGHEYGTEFKETIIEFAGTSDGTPPMIRVVKGSIKVNGEIIEQAVQLEDGAYVEIEGQVYNYLRGSRR